MLSVQLLVVALIGCVYSKQFVFQNNLSQTVWVGSLGNSGKTAPNSGGFAVGSKKQVTVTTDDSWAGRFWGRSGCHFDGNGNGHCDTGDCGNKLKCSGAGGTPPATLAEFTLNGWGGLDYYDVSLVDGFNLPVRIAPLSAKVDPNNQYSCGTAGCSNNLNGNCPSQLRQKNSAGQTVGCKSSCFAFNTDQYCCRGSFGTPQTCKTNNWAVNSATYFKNNCRGAYSYAYDDQKSTYTCKNNGYRITFG